MVFLFGVLPLTPTLIHYFFSYPGYQSLCILVSPLFSFPHTIGSGTQGILLQKKILRCIKFQPFTAPSAPLFYSLKILKLEDMIHFNISTFVFKAINKLSPKYFHNYFTPNSSAHGFGTRQATKGDLFPSLKRTTLYGLKTVQYFGSKLWNTLPLFIRVAGSISIFRSKLKTHFIDSYV